MSFLPITYTDNVTAASAETFNALQSAILSQIAAQLAAAVLKANNGADFADAGTTRANLHVPVLSLAMCAATANVALSGLQTIDSYTLLAGDMVLCVGQSNGVQNGLWVAASGAWTRPSEYGTGVVLKARTCGVIAGTLGAGRTYVLLTDAAVTVDTTATTWVRQQPASVVDATGATALYVPLANGSGGYVWGAQSGGGGGGSIGNSRTLSASGAILSSDQIVYLNATAGGFVATLPTAVGFTGILFLVATTTNTNLVTIASTAAQTVDGYASGALTLGDSYSTAPYSSITLGSDNANWHIL